MTTYIGIDSLQEEKRSIMEVIVHYPQTATGQEALANEVARIHADHAFQMIQKLSCPIEQQKRLLSLIVKENR